MSNAEPIWVFTPRHGERIEKTKKGQQRCAYHVFTGRRQDWGGHQCSRQMFKEVSGFPACYIHYNKLTVRP